jgi:hypothetical protein
VVSPGIAQPDGVVPRVIRPPAAGQAQQAALADRVLFPPDRKIVDELAAPTPAGVSGRMKDFEPVGRWG